MKFKPLNNRVLVKPDTVGEKKTKYGLVLPEGKELPATGVVVIGNEDVKEGEKVVFSKFGYDEVAIDDQRHYLVSAASILGKFT